MAPVVRRPSGKWQATVRKDGRLLSKSFTKRVDATSWSRETELNAERGALTQPKQQPSAVTVADVLRSYADKVSARRQATSGDVERIRLRTLARSRLATQLLIQMTSADLVKWCDNRLKKVKPSTVVREMTLLRCAIGHALDGSGAVNVGHKSSVHT